MQYRQRSIFVHVVLGTFIVDNDRLSIRLFNLTFHQSILSSLTKGNDSWCFIYNLFIINSQLYNISYTQSVFLNTLKNLFNEQQSTCTGTLYVLFSCGKDQKRYDKFPKIAITATCITKYSLIHIKFKFFEEREKGVLTIYNTSHDTGTSKGADTDRKLFSCVYTGTSHF